MQWLTIFIPTCLFIKCDQMRTFLKGFVDKFSDKSSLKFWQLFGILKSSILNSKLLFLLFGQNWKIGLLILFDVSYHFCTTATFQYFSNTSLWATIEKIGLLFIPTYGHIRSVYHFILCNPVFFQQLGWEPWSSDYEFISRYCILDGHFFIFICCKKCKVCLNGRK